MEQHISNIQKLGQRKVVLQPKLKSKKAAFRKFCQNLKKSVGKSTKENWLNVVAQAREDVQAMASGPALNSTLALQFCSSVVVDMVTQGWQLKIGRENLKLQSPIVRHATPLEIKQRIRAGHLFERDAQLRERSVREFVRSMEKRRQGPNGWTSIFSLMRDGRELSEKLKSANDEKDELKRAKVLASVISPYIQIADSETICRFTGLRLIDIWRYFRYTWVSAYKSLPGRSMMLLVRDAAVPSHPVIGIAALGSSMAQQTLRDQWIGWNSETFLENIQEKPETKWCKWIHKSVKRLLRSIYKNDFIEEGIIKPSELEKPTIQTTEKLMEVARLATEAHRIDAAASDHKRSAMKSGKSNWISRAKTPLFRAKRAKTIALLLGIRRNLRQAGLRDQTAICLKTILENSQGRHAVRQLVRLVKAEHVGVNMMDIIICGAVAPYNPLLGGKLVCTMLMSPEVVRFYHNRYRKQASVIASSMKGSVVVREPKLVLLATTSLYGVGSSQYNRIRVPVSKVGGNGSAVLEYIELGVSRGYGSYHFSKASIDYLETLLPRGGAGRKVNSIFGEGVNPLIRKLRDGLDFVGLPADDLLLHGNSRVVYVIPIAENFRDILLGQTTKPKHYLSQKHAARHSRMLAHFWRERWLTGRIDNPDILLDVSRHSLAHPIEHAAKVRLPEMDAELSLLFGK